MRLARRSAAEISARFGEHKAGRGARTKAWALLTKRFATTKRALCSVVLRKCRAFCLRFPAAPILPRFCCWRRAGPKKRIKRAPKLLAVTVDHGLRPESAREAAAVGKLARRFGVRHTILRWRGAKPKTGLQEAARHARYRLLAQAAARANCEHVLTAHTLDDQAETVLFRLARGSGLTGLAGMAYALPIPVGEEQAVFLVRPLLGVSKARLVATLRAAGVAHSEDPTNRDPRFARTRLRVSAGETRGRRTRCARLCPTGGAHAARRNHHRVRRRRRTRRAGAAAVA